MDDLTNIPPTPEFKTIDDPKSWRRSALASVLLSLVTTVIAVSALAYDTFLDASANVRAGKERLAIADEIGRLRADLDVDEARTACRTLLGTEITNGQVTVLAELGELIVVVATVNRENPDESRLRVRAAIDDLDAATRRLVMATQVRDRYLADGSPLPCPLSDD